MHQIEFHKRAKKALKRVPQNRAAQILDAIDELAATPDPSTHRNVKTIRGDEPGFYRLRVGEYRALFELIELENGDIALLIHVTAIGTRGDIYG